MKVIDALTSPGSQNNEDLIKGDNTYFLLLDGSTGLNKNLVKGYPSDAIWFVTAVSDYIEKEIERNIDTIEILKNLILYINREYASFNLGNIDRVDMPSASLVLVRDRVVDIEIFSLGDCTTLIETKEGNVEVIHDGRVTDLDNKVIEKMKAISKEKNITILETHNYIMQDLIANRNKKNTEEGYQVLGFDQIEENNLAIKKYPKNEIKNICVFSDGVSDYYETLKLAENVYEFYNRVKEKNLKAILDEIRTRQNNDLSCVLYPRLKAKDDASIVTIKP